MAVVFDTIMIDIMKRSAHPIRGFTNRLNMVNLGKFERDTSRNCKILRNFIANHVNRVRREFKNQESRLLERGDFLGYLIHEFKDNNELIIDEMVEFFLAAT